MQRPIAYGLLIGLLLMTLGASSATAHSTVYSPDGKIKFVYGHLGEPIFTNQKTGLDLGIYDNATGGPISGLEYRQGGANLEVKYRYGGEGGQTLDISTGFVAQHGAAGKYTYPILFTKPGLYNLLLKGTINGTAYDMVIPPAHEVRELDTIMWPTDGAGQADQETRIAKLESDVESLKKEGGGTSPMPTAALIIAALALVAVWARRKR